MIVCVWCPPVFEEVQYDLSRREHLPACVQNLQAIRITSSGAVVTMNYYSSI